MELIRREAQRQGLSMSELIRRAVDEFLGADTYARKVAKARAAVGGFRSGTTTTSIDHDEVLAEGGW